MPTTSQGVEPIGGIIHKKKEAKKKQKAKGQLPIGSREGSTQSNQRQEKSATGVAERLAAKERIRNQILNQEIDRFLNTLFNEGIASEKFGAWYAKCCHQLGIKEVNRLAVNARNGNDPQRLFSYKLKGALQLHYKDIVEE